MVKVFCSILNEEAYQILYNTLLIQYLYLNIIYNILHNSLHILQQIVAKCICITKKIYILSTT